MTQRLAFYFKEYMEYHETRGNQVCHFFGIPLIAISLLGLLSIVTFGNPAWKTAMVRPDLGIALLFFSLCFYLYVDWKIAAPFSLALVGMYFLGRSFSWQFLIILQIIGWIFQYVGHLKYEKKSPAFYKNLTHILIGPLWVFSKAVGYTKI